MTPQEEDLYDKINKSGKKTAGSSRLEAAGEIMIIGIDIDNTITYTTEKIMQYAAIFGRAQGLNTVPDLRGYYLEQALGWPSEAVGKFFELYLANIYREVEPKEQVANIIRQIKQNHQIILISSRNYQYPGMEQTTREWLSQHDITYNKLILNATPDMHNFSKLPVCLEHGVDLMIEDHRDLALELSRFMPVILFDYPYNRDIESENIIRVGSWAEAQDWVNRLAQEGIAQPGA
jgi:uncharacterized HAD superfamily protein